MRACEICGRELVRLRRATGMIESLTDYNKRRTCGNPKCAHELKSRTVRGLSRSTLSYDYATHPAINAFLRGAA